MTVYPHTRRHRVERVTGGVTHGDDFAWLEEANDETAAWQEAQDELARGFLQGPEFAAFHKHLSSGYDDVFSFYAPRPAGGRWFHRFVPEGQRFPVISVSEVAAERGATLIDFNAPGPDEGLVLTDIVPSPDGTKLLYAGSMDGGFAEMRVRAIDVATGEQLWSLPHCLASFPIWVPDGSAVMFMSMGEKTAPDGSKTAGTAIFSYDVASDQVKQIDLEIPHPAAWPEVNPAGTHAIISIDQTAPRPAYVRRLDGGQWQPFLRDFNGTLKGTVVGQNYVGITTAGAPKGRLVSVPLGDPGDPESWIELVPETDEKLVALSVLGDKLLLAYFRDAAAGLRLLSPDGTIDQEIELPGKGAIGKYAIQFVLSIMDNVTWIDGDTLSFVYSSLKKSPASYAYSLQSQATVPAGDAPRDIAGDVVYREARNRDRSVPYRIFAQGPIETPRPTILTGYGGYNVPYLACYSPMAAAWVEMGGVWVHAHLRGGGEFGETWWREGRRETKTNTFNDLFAVAEALIADGVATTNTLGFFGSSNGGLLAGAAISFRPDLFRAVVPQVPLLDTLNYHRDPASYAIGMADYGDPNSPQDAPFLRDWSPYHNLREGVEYPAVLLDAGEKDESCPPWHSRKFAAFLQGQTARGPILLRVRKNAGHNNMSREGMIQRDAEELGFFAEELGLKTSHQA